jgi:hypothetical protein
MKLAIMQPYLFPYLGYFQLINAVDKFVILDDVNYIKKGWINRNRILLNGQEFIFTIPLEMASQNKLINEINLSLEGGWRRKLLKTFDAAYKKAPTFKVVYPLIERIIDFKERNLSTFISYSIEQICKYLEINTTIVYSSSQYETKNLKGQNKILEICKIEKARIYINPFGGLEIYQRKTFEKHSLKLMFLKSKPINYKQFRNDFKPFLSIIDVMMFNGKDIISGYLNEYELI